MIDPFCVTLMPAEGSKVLACAMFEFSSLSSAEFSLEDLPLISIGAIDENSSENLILPSVS